LYGINTLGAVSGVLLAGFVFIPRLGMDVSNYVAVSLDALVGVVSLFLARRFDQSSEVVAGIVSDAALLQPVKKDRRSKGLLIALGASGFLSLALEVVWFRALILIFGSTTYSFSAMLGIFLIGLSLGSLIVSRYADRVKQPVLLFGGAAVITGIFTLISLHWFTKMPEFLLSNLMLSGTPSWEKMIGLKFVITLIFLLVPTLLFGASFTAATKAIREAMNSSTEAVGEAAMFNTIGAALGAFFGGFILLPNTGMRLGLMICAVLVLLLGGILLYTHLREKRWQLSITGLVVIVMGWLIISPPQWDKQVMSSGPYFSPWNYIEGDSITLSGQLDSERLLYFNEGITSTISVIQTPDEVYSYCSQGKVEADTSDRSMMLQRMMGHLPMLFHPDPQRAVNIGLGAGVTFGAVSCYPADHLEVVEFEPSVVNIAKVWSNYNHSVISKENITVTINDGRNHLFVCDEPYDVITSDPFEPVMAGAANLYTVEFFELAKSRLAEGGIMAQYLPLYELSSDNYASIIKSFVKVFPESQLFFTGFDTIMLGFKGDALLSLEVAADKFNITEVKKSLSEIGFDRPELLFSMFVAHLGDIERNVFNKYNFNTDNNPIVEFSAPKNTFHYTSEENQIILLELFSNFDEAMCRDLTQEQLDLVKRNSKALQTVLRANLAKSSGNLNQAMELLNSAMEMIDSNPVVINEIISGLITAANFCHSNGNIEGAIHYYSKIIDYNESEFWALYHLVNLHMQSNDLKKALIYLNLGLEKYHKESPLFIALRGKIRCIYGDREGGLEDLKKALEILPKSNQIRSDYNLFKANF
jgi:spermidine synthase